MSSIKHLEMAAALSAYPHIEIKKSLFSTKAIYTPTHSQVKAYILEYSPSEGERLERLLEMPFDKMAADIQHCSASATFSTSQSSSRASMRARM